MKGLRMERAIAPVVGAYRRTFKTEYRWNRWFVRVWAGVAVTLLVLLRFLPFWKWFLVAAPSFGTMEGVGLRKMRDAFPPLTHVIRRYVPRWLAFTAIFGIWGATIAYWLSLPRPYVIGVATALLGWLNDHFDVTYDREAPYEVSHRPGP